MRAGTQTSAAIGTQPRPAQEEPGAADGDDKADDSRCGEQRPVTGRRKVREQEEGSQREQPEPQEPEVPPSRQQHERQADTADRAARPGELGRHLDTTTSAACECPLEVT